MSVYPITLPHEQIRRILDRRASMLVRTSVTKLGNYEVHDALTITKNARYRRAGRSDHQLEPRVFNIEVITVTAKPLLELDLLTVRRTGHKTLEDFYDDWLSRRRRIVIDLEVQLCEFEIIEEARYLHKKVHRGYTTDPAEAVPDEPAALTSAELSTMVEENWTRFRTGRGDAQTRGELRSLAIRLRAASRTGDMQAAAAIRRELERLEQDAA